MQEPFRYCHGNIMYNLKEMAGGSKPDETCSAQAWELLRLGYPIEPLVEVRQEIKAAPWSTLGTEQLHAGAATVHKYHPQVGADVLAARSFLWCFRSLLAAPEEQERLQMLRRSLEKLQKTAPRKVHVTGRQLFLKDAIAEARQRKAGGGQLTSHAMKEIDRFRPQLSGLGAARSGVPGNLSSGPEMPTGQPHSPLDVRQM